MENTEGNYNQFGFDLKAYMRVIGIPEYQELKPTIETLYLITSKQVQNFHFVSHSFMVKDRKPLDFSIKALQDRLVKNREGGICFENQKLFIYALRSLGFEAKTFPTCVFKAGQRSDVPAHCCTLVTIDGQDYFIDASSGFNGIRYPLKFTPGKPGDSYEVQLQKGEGYAIGTHEGYCSVSIQARDRFVGFLSFDYPLKFFTDDEVEDLYKFRFNTPDYNRLREDVIVAGKIVEEGRYGYEYYVNQEPFLCYKTIFLRGVNTKINYENYNEWKAVVEQDLLLQLPALEDLAPHKHQDRK